ncbi:MAG: hypothetical protein QM764_16160 [Chitinophagaceae bacterium]
MHPLITLPIVLGVIVFGFLFLTPANENWYITAMDIMLIFSSLSAVVAALMGLFSGKVPTRALAWHKWMGVVALFLFAVAAFGTMYKVTLSDTFVRPRALLLCWCTFGGDVSP